LKLSKLLKENSLLPRKFENLKKVVSFVIFWTFFYFPYLINLAQAVVLVGACGGAVG